MKTFLALLLFAFSLHAQTASYPGSVVTNQQLKVVKNNCQPTLSSSINSTDTSLVLSSNTCVVPNLLVTIDSEIISICNVVGNVATVGNSSCPNVDGRGFDGTVAASHSAGRNVSAFVDAWNFAAPAAEIKAIETALGPNLANVNAGNALNSATYNFTPQTPGGSLVIGANPVVMVPVPPGVNGTDSGHTLYVSGGTGTAEACLITGGAGTALQPSGTIIINCANTHSGAWTIRSATGGVQEAVQAAQTAGAGLVSIPAGGLDFYGGVKVTGSNVWIVGSGLGTLVTDHNTSDPAFSFNNGGSTAGGNALLRLQIQAADSTGHGVMGIYLYNQNSALVRDVAQYEPRGIVADGNSFGIFIQRCKVTWVATATHAAIEIAWASDVFISDCYLESDPTNHTTAGILLSQGNGIVISRSDVIHFSRGLEIQPTSGQVTGVFVNQTFFDSSFDAGIFINPTGTALVQQVIVAESWSNSGNAGSQVDGVFIKAETLSTVNGVTFVGHEAQNNGGHGFEVTQAATGGVKNVALIGCKANGNSVGNSGTFDGVRIGAGVSNFQIIGGVFGPSDNYPDIQEYGIAVASGSSNNYQITNTNVLGNITAGLLALGGPNVITGQNLGVDNVIGLASSGATLAMPINPLFTIPGTTGVTAITGCAAGRAGSFRTTDGTITFSAGASIGNTLTTTQNVPTFYACDGTHTWLR